MVSVLDVGRMGRFSYLVAGALFSALPSVAVAGSYVLGDSIGDGVAIVSGQQDLAQIGIHIRGPKALAQIAQTPAGATAFIFLGTNDAESSLKNIDKSIDDIVAAAARRRLDLTWLGPHCVRKPWDARARELDGLLRSRLAATSIRYVSMRDARICSGVFHEPDGVHLTMKGYRYMWEIARNAANAAAPGSQPKGSAQADTGETTGSVPAPYPQGRDADSGSGGRLVTEIHIPASPSAPLTWTRGIN
jgi:hypothetical protein